MVERGVAGISTRAWCGGRRSEAPTLVFIHGGVAGVTPYCSGAHVWGAVLERLADEREVIALDLPGAGGTSLPDGPWSFDTIASHVAASLDAFGVREAHLVGHDLGGLVALDLAALQPNRVAAVTTVASIAASPSGDTVENLTFAHPPAPLYSRASQRWAFERVAWSDHWIDAGLLDACVASAGGEPHREAQRRVGEAADAFHTSVTQARLRFFERCRGDGFQLPVQVIAGSHDPLGTLDQTLWQFRLVAARQVATQMHVINRAGALPFRDQPVEFVDVVAAFAEAVAD